MLRLLVGSLLAIVWVPEAVDSIAPLTPCELLNLIVLYFLRMTWIVGAIYHDQLPLKKIIS